VVVVDVRVGGEESLQCGGDQGPSAADARPECED
jgi:hypothetical protein